MANKIPIILCVDVEPDGFFIDRNNPLPWKGFEKAHAFFKELKPRLETSTGRPVHLSWFFRMDPQVAETYGSATWPITHYSKLISDIEDSGDEIGLHVHAYHWSDEENRWILDHGNQNWIDYCIRSSCAAYREACGRNCGSFRFGDHWMNNDTIALLQDLGIQFDLTVEPGMPSRPSLHMNQRYTGSLPDYAHALRHPYQPNTEDFLRQSEKNGNPLCEIPMSTGEYGPSFSPIRGIYYQFFNPQRLKKTCYALNIRREPEIFQSIVNQRLGSGFGFYLAPVIRTGAFNNEAFVRNMRKNLDFLMSHAYTDRFIFMTAYDFGMSLKNSKVFELDKAVIR